MTAFDIGGDLYLTLFEHHPQALWVYDRETLRFLAVNQSAMDRYGYSRSEFLAMTIADIRPEEDLAALRANLDRVTSGRDEAGVWRHRAKDGRVFPVGITSHTLDFEGRAAELVMVTDVDAQLAAEEALAEVQAQQLARYSRLLNLMRSPDFKRGDEASVLRAVTEMVSQMIAVERVSVWRFTPGGDALVAAELYEAGGGMSAVDAGNSRHSSGTRLERRDFPRYFRALETDEVVVADDARSDLRTSEFTSSYLDLLGITSMLDAPILGESGVEGVLCLEHVGPPREWSPTERSFAISAANAVSLLLAQAAHARSEERFRLLSRATNDAIWDWDLATDALWWGEGFETLFGFKRDEVGGTIESWSTRIHPDDRAEVLADIHEAIESGRIAWSKEYRFLYQEGGYAWVLDRGHVIRSPEGKALRMVGGMTDLTERRKLETFLRESQKLESVGRLAGGVAHDFNNLLTVIRGILDLHLEGAGGMGVPEGLAADLREVRAAAERATELTRQLLAFSRQRVLEPRVLDLNEVVDQLATMLRRLIGEDVTLSFRPDPELLAVRADPAGIEQVLVNLVVNARDAMRRGGEIVIETRSVEGDERAEAGGSEEEDEVARSRGWIELEVRDTGHGMDEGTLARCTEPFFTTKPPDQGTGLGLSTVYGIVTQSEGQLLVSSEVGRGTVVRIRLPATREAKGKGAGETPAGARGGSETVLLVEDEPAVCRLGARILSSAGYRVLTAGAGEEALALAREEPPDFLVTDVVMPGMSGPELAERLTAELPGLPVLFTSGYTADAMDRHGLSGEEVAFLRKPYSIAEFLAKVREALDRDRGGG